MATRIVQRAAASNASTLRHNQSVKPTRPTRHNSSSSISGRTKGRCGLCQRHIPVPPTAPLLQPSPDRKDSNNPSYTKENLHITHLGCNYAKNKFTTDEFEECWTSSRVACFKNPDSDVCSRMRDVMEIKSIVNVCSSCWRASICRIERGRRQCGCYSGTWIL